MNCKLIRLVSLTVIAVMLLSVGAFAESTPPAVLTDAVILVDAESGVMLYGHNETKQVYPASTTKIMVALLALENLELDQTVTASASAVNLLPPGHTNIGILAGEQLTVRQLLYALMLPSAGDAANVLGENISGSVDEFVKLMNKRALELGMNNTNYMNTSGAHDDRHYTTAADMAILTRKAMENASFREIVATEVYIIPPTEKYEEERRLTNTNKLIQKNTKYYYQYATGVKTGYTNPAKLCLVSTATKKNLSLVCVALGAESENGNDMRFVDSKNVFEYGFNNYKRDVVVEMGSIVEEAPIRSAKGARKALLEAETTLTHLMPIDGVMGEITREVEIQKNIKANVSKGQVLGTAEYFVDGVSVGKVNLVSAKDYVFDPVKEVLNVIGDVLTSPWLYLPFVLFFVVLVIIRQYNYNIRRKKRMELRKQQMREEAEKRRAAMKRESFMDDFLNK